MLPLDFDPQRLLVPHWPFLGVALVVAVWLLLPRTKTTPVDVARELLIVIPGYLLYTTVRGLVDGREMEAFRRAADIIQFERGLHIFWETDIQQQILHQGWLIQLANSTYAWAHWPVIIATAVWLFFFHRGIYSTYRNAFLLSGAMALIIYAALPVAPPRFMEAWGFVDTVANYSSAYEFFQPPAFVNQYAALPSLHFGWNLLAGLAIVRHARPRPVKLLAMAMPAAVFLSIVTTGNHFIIDGIAGGAVVLLALAASTKLRELGDRDRADMPHRAPGLQTPA